MPRIFELRRASTSVSEKGMDGKVTPKSERVQKLPHPRLVVMKDTASCDRPLRAGNRVHVQQRT
jgi:hypothetical protein